jgi:5-methylcytosine-specific restriction endonuclease McrA
MFEVTAEWIEQFKTPRGGFCAAQVKAIGVDWPLVSGWKARVVGSQISDEQRRTFEAGSLGRAEARKLAVELLGAKAKSTSAERRAERELAKHAKVAEHKRSKSFKKAVRQANKIAKKLRPEKLVVSGVSVCSNDFLQTYEWRRVRMEALKKYGPVCQCCGASPSTGAVMNVDHIKPRKLFPQLALDVDNLQILCGECNHGKGNWDMTDWRPAEEPLELIRLVRDIGAS